MTEWFPHCALFDLTTQTSRLFPLWMWLVGLDSVFSHVFEASKHHWQREHESGMKTFIFFPLSFHGNAHGAKNFYARTSECFQIYHSRWIKRHGNCVKLYIPPRAISSDETRQTFPAEARVREEMKGCGSSNTSVMKHPQQQMPSNFLWNKTPGSESNPTWWSLPLRETNSNHSRQVSPELLETLEDDWT